MSTLQRQMISRYRTKILKEFLVTDTSQQGDISAEMLAFDGQCKDDYRFFIENACQIVDIQRGEWVQFKLWDGQQRVLTTAHEERQLLALKARQIGLSWLFLGYALWLLLYKPISNVLLLSVRDAEAMELLKRLKDMYDHLPKGIRQLHPIKKGTNNKHEIEFENGSAVKSLPNTAGDSYTATFVLLDEADLYDMNAALVRVKPTIDAGGKLVAISKSNKAKPESGFKRLYRAAKAGQTTAWKAVFLAWSERPDRNEEWYETIKQDILVRTGSLDELHENYPATDTEALAAKTLDKRIPATWLEQCYVEQVGFKGEIHGVTIYSKPKQGREYVIAADPAEGNPNSDDSAFTVLDRETWEEVASFAGKTEPGWFGEIIAKTAEHYNDARVLIERNNHGHAVLLWLRKNTATSIIRGEDGKHGFQTTGKSKTMLYTLASETLRDKGTIIHTFATMTQLQSIDGNTLSAPEGEHDDRAMSFVLALWAAQRPTIGYRL